jgi:hypothetical protein
VEDSISQQQLRCRYGEIIPNSSFGAVVGYVTMLVGILAVALPISVISSTFGEKHAEFTVVCKVRW